MQYKYHTKNKLIGYISHSTVQMKYWLKKKNVKTAENWLLFKISTEWINIVNSCVVLRYPQEIFIPIWNFNVFFYLFKECGMFYFHCAFDSWFVFFFLICIYNWIIICPWLKTRWMIVKLINASYVDPYRCSTLMIHWSWNNHYLVLCEIINHLIGWE